MNDWSQMSIFDTNPSPTARGPEQCKLTLESLSKDGLLKDRIMNAVLSFSHPVTDDDIVDHLERRFNQRFQRNVIARMRGLLEESGWLTQGPNVTGRSGRPTHTTGPSMKTLELTGKL